MMMMMMMRIYTRNLATYWLWPLQTKHGLVAFDTYNILLKQRFDIKALDDRVLGLLDNQDIDDEINHATEFENRISKTVVDIEMELEMKPKVSSPPTTQGSTAELKLPTLDLKRFKGDRNSPLQPSTSTVSLKTKIRIVRHPNTRYKYFASYYISPNLQSITAILHLKISSMTISLVPLHQSSSAVGKFLMLPLLKGVRYRLTPCKRTILTCLAPKFSEVTDFQAVP